MCVHMYNLAANTDSKKIVFFLLKFSYMLAPNSVGM